MSRNDLKLTIELVPETAWGQNLRAVYTHKVWDRIRKSVYVRARHRCEICGYKHPKRNPDCHEVWEWEEETGTQRLLGFIGLCKRCHGVKHFHRSLMTGQGEAMFEHLCAVNGLTHQEATDYINKELDAYQRRNAIEWTLDISVMRTGQINWLKRVGDIQEA